MCVCVIHAYSWACELQLCSEYRNKLDMGAGGTMWVLSVHRGLCGYYGMCSVQGLLCVRVSWVYILGMLGEGACHSWRCNWWCIGDVWACWNTWYVMEMWGTICVKGFWGSGFLEQRMCLRSELELVGGRDHSGHHTPFLLPQWKLSRFPWPTSSFEGDLPYLDPQTSPRKLLTLQTESVCLLEEEWWGGVWKTKNSKKEKEVAFAILLANNLQYSLGRRKPHHDSWHAGIRTHWGGFGWNKAPGVLPHAKQNGLLASACIKAWLQQPGLLNDFPSAKSQFPSLHAHLSRSQALTDSVFHWHSLTLS